MNSHKINNILKAKKRLEQLKWFRRHAFVYVLFNTILYSVILAASTMSSEMTIYLFFNTIVFWGICLGTHFLIVWLPNTMMYKNWLAAEFSKQLSRQ